MNNSIKHSFCINIKAFTIIELMVVLAIIGIISGVMITAINPAQQFKKGRDATRKKDLAVLSAGLEQIHSIANQYPSSDGNDLSGCASSDHMYCSIECLKTALLNGNIDCDKSNGIEINEKIMQSVPEDPSLDNGFNYCYAVDSTNQNYTICTALESVNTYEGDYSPTCYPLTPPAGRGVYGRYCITNPF